MKKLMITSLLVLFGLGMVFSQKPLKERIVSSVELTALFPKNGSDANAQCGSTCEPKKTLFKPFDDKVNKWKLHFENTKPSDINMSDYTNPGMAGTPGQSEIELMQTYSTLVVDNQNLVVDYSTRIGEVKNKFEDKWITEMDKFANEVKKCPSSSEGAAADASCVNPIKSKYEKILNQLIDEYIKELSPVLNEYKSKIKTNNAVLEDNLAKLDYGDKASMPGIKQVIFGLQGGLMSLVVGYGESVVDMWATACGKYTEIKNMKDRIY